jgi:hypothetical protein
MTPQPRRPERPSRRLPGLLALLGPVALAAVEVLAVEVRPCAGQPVEVAGDTAHAEEVCAASLAALEQLATLGLAPAQPIRIVLVEQGILHGSGLAYGQYDGGRNRLELMSPRAIAAQQPAPTQFGRAIDGVIYAGLVAHELTHAIAQQHKRVESLGHAAQEYLAYAVEIASLPDAVREAVIATAGVAGWESGDSISTVYLGLNVHRFAVKSYLHLHDHPAPKSVVEAVLGSRAWVFTAP